MRVTTVVYPPGKSSDLLLQYLDPAETQVINPWGKRLNIPALIHMTLSGRRTRFDYLISYLKLARPKYLITTSDNDLNFYRIKSILPSVTTISIQNGLRANYSSVPGQGFIESIERESGLSSDFAITFGSAISDLLKTHIATNTFVAGSLRNNTFHAIGVTEESDLIMYVSQLPNHETENTSTVAYYQGHEITYSEFYSAERIICDQLAEYCSNNQLRFEICGKQSSTFSHESEYFKPHKVSSRNTPLGSYEQLVRANLIVTLDSTLGYELLARGKRVVFIGGRFARHHELIVRNMKGIKFGFPLDEPSNGPFWTDNLSGPQIRELLDQVRSMSHNEWAMQINQYKNLFMKFDPDNKELVSFLTALGLPILSDKPRVA
jgi:surface carbohydrate biosynthesis protein